jgi:phosphatidylserine decarboxylase
MEPILLYNRKTKSIEEEAIFEKGAMDFLFGSNLGFLASELFLKRKFATDLYAWRMHSPASRPRIRAFINNYGIDTSEIERPVDSYGSFNEFFIRKLKPEARPIDRNPDHLISTADCRLSVHAITERGVLPVKARSFGVAELIGNESLARQYTGGLCLIFRLAPVDYHRFCFVDDCEQSPMRKIRGAYRSVHPFSLRRMKAVFTENQREYCILKTANFGEVIHIDVGATCVGRIVQTAPGGGRFRRGEEKGYFEFGGSTCILLFFPNTITIDEDIKTHAAQGIETIVRYGERIGKKKV